MNRARAQSRSDGARARNRIELGYRCPTFVAGVIGSFSIPSCQVARTRVAQIFDYEHRFTEHEHRCAEHDVAREKSCAIQSPMVWLVSPIRIGRIGTRRKKPEPRNAREQRAVRFGNWTPKLRCPAISTVGNGRSCLVLEAFIRHTGTCVIPGGLRLHRLRVIALPVLLAPRGGGDWNR